MIDKVYHQIERALHGVKDGDTILVGGFGAVGQPSMLIEGLLDYGVRDLTLVANNAGEGRAGIAGLLEAGRVRRLVCSYPRTSGAARYEPSVFEHLYRAGRIELELSPQGTLAERLRAAGAGIPAFYTPASVGTELAKDKETRTIDGRTYVLEFALKGDVALVDAWKADRWGNLTYRGTARNFNPLMAAAASLTVASVEAIVELGDIPPAEVTTPGIYVDRVLLRSNLDARVDA